MRLAPAFLAMSRLTLTLALSLLLTNCYMYKYFHKSNATVGDQTPNLTGSVIGSSLGAKAGGINDAALAAVHAVITTHKPAAIRPDPDMLVRRLLRQYRPEGATVARQTGQVEQYRLLLGGAPQDFNTAPAHSYDATSLLAVEAVAEETCRGLVAPNSSEHPGWQTILPYPPGQEAQNIAWLAQRFIGKPSAGIDASVYAQLTAIMVAEEPFLSQNWWFNDYAKYIPVCATLSLDSEALYF